jgi:uncharacterized membrane protein (UPF0127 family)
MLLRSRNPIPRITNDPASSTSTVDPPDSEESDERLPDNAQLRATLVVALVIGVAILAITGVVTFSSAFAESSGLESSVISDRPPTHRVFFENQRGHTLWVYDVWVAETGPERYHGLSAPATLPADTGLLFVYDQEVDDRAIVLREMNYPIDIVFIDGSGTVTAVHSALTEPDVPEDDLTHYSGRAKWMLEIPHGTAESYAIVPGTSVRITGSTHSFDSQLVLNRERDMT